MRLPVKIALGFVAGTTALTVIFRDADFYAMRDRWEHFTLALFGPWQNAGECLDDIPAPHCEESTLFERTFSEMDDFNFFKTTPVAGTPLEVIAGVSFRDARAVMSGTVDHAWCYLPYGTGTVTRQLNLATRAGDGAVRYAALDQVSEPELMRYDLTGARLGEIARSHCRFDAFNFDPNTHHNEETSHAF